MPDTDRLMAILEEMRTLAKCWYKQELMNLAVEAQGLLLKERQKCSSP